MPYDVLDFMRDSDLLLDEIDTLDFDFNVGLPAFHHGPTSIETSQQAEPGSCTSDVQGQEGTISMIEVFKRSPWFWKPSSAQNAFSDHPRIPLESDNVDVAASPHWPYSVDLLIQDKLDQQTRDRILQLVIQTVGTRVSIPSFPSSEFLDVLIKNGIAKKIETDAWIHPHTFCSRSTRTELLAALIAAGCVCFGIMSVGKTGGMLQEIVRVALNNLVESDNSVIRDLQYLQAYMIWLDIGICCGYRRKMEIAESHFQPLCTALRKAGAFNKSFYKRIIPSPSDDDETLEVKWRQWVEQESYKRLVYHLFEHDIQVTFSMTRNPLTSYAEFSVPFPAERDIWLASSPTAWRAIHLSKVRASDPVFNSLKDILIKPERLNALSGDADFNLSTSIFVHGIGALVWDYRKQASITQDTETHDDPTAQLWMQSRRHDM
ncbi:Transcription factor fungi [Macrophomina phaseolina MS6]|uniref:Transcription factor fungi n=1 Tax=Macrophomina phaseolina (strain MS6) TaxID=1126212 RepID=K2SLR7_MACPH|nr:Transcription factor fungi [Macrophomina phaseolina MS6]